MSDSRYDEFLDAIDAGEPFYLRCPQDHASLPPQRICPECRSKEVTREPLSRTGEIKTYSVVTVPLPQLSDNSPYIVAIADFGPLNITGHCQGMDPENVKVGKQVSVSVTMIEEKRTLVFEPQ